MVQHFYRTDTIAAISTALGDSGIGIIRISGKRALKIGDRIFRSPNNIRPSACATHTMHYGHIVDRKNKNGIIDEVIVSVMRSPRTFTREDILEVNCHGGVVPLKKVLDLILKNGARLAEPGEFTQRAFLNGRIDLVQAEAVMNIIGAKTERALKPAVFQLEGIFSSKIKMFKERLVALIAPLEASIDFPDDELHGPGRKKTIKDLRKISAEIKKFIDNADRGIMLQNGVNVVLAGPPNVGKSSIMNAFLDYERVIVTHISGTTRDVVQEVININGLTIRLADTAGIMQSDCFITRESINRSLACLERADLVLFVLDAARKPGREEAEIACKLEGKKVILVLNKSDLKSRVDPVQMKKIFPAAPRIRISALKKTGLELLKRRIYEMFFKGEIINNDEVLVGTLRQKEYLEKAYTCLLRAEEILTSGGDEACLAFEIKQALQVLSEILGEEFSEEVLDSIFSRFCVGK